MHVAPTRNIVYISHHELETLNAIAVPIYFTMHTKHYILYTVHPTQASTKSKNSNFWVDSLSQAANMAFTAWERLAVLGPVYIYPTL